MPTVNAPCAKDGVICEYGSDVNEICNTLRICETYGNSTKWVMGQPIPPGYCPTQDPGLSNTCPQTLDAAVGACGDTSLVCHYVNGFCACHGDAGPQWSCDTQVSGCPHPRPDLGSPCGVEGTSCSYLACVVPWGIFITCEAGIWQLSSQCSP